MKSLKQYLSITVLIWVSICAASTSLAPIVLCLRARKCAITNECGLIKTKFCKFLGPSDSVFHKEPYIVRFFSKQDPINCGSCACVRGRSSPHSWSVSVGGKHGEGSRQLADVSAVNFEHWCTSVEFVHVMRQCLGAPEVTNIPPVTIYEMVSGKKPGKISEPTITAKICVTRNSQNPKQPKGHSKGMATKQIQSKRLHATN